MLGNKLKLWMENYIVRSRKKEVQKGKFKMDSNGAGLILESSESLAHSDTGISSGSQQILSSSTPDNREGYSSTTMESERSESTHCHTTVSLPSPESAYSTGYSTDGTSPGAPGPPEYYINIRTGKHYFPSPTPTPTSPKPDTTFWQLHSMNQCLTTTLLPEASCLTSALTCSSRAISSSTKSSDQTSSEMSNSFPPQVDTFVSEIPGPSRKQNFLSTSVPGQFENVDLLKSSCKKTSAKSQLASLKLFLKSPKREKEKPKAEVSSILTFENKKRLTSNGKSKKWFKQPFQKFGHRRTDSCSEVMIEGQIKREIYLEKNFSHLSSQENSASPRQRNRIKTNPWLPTEPMSSQNLQNLQIDFSPRFTRNRSCSNTPLQNRKEGHVDLQQNHINHFILKSEESKNHANHIEKAINRPTSGVLVTESNDYSDEDLTLNEMMGTYNESYVYEKETDILSDSDPTDCEDYETDSEADNGGDELDFIDNGSATESDDSSPMNTGKCTYFDIHIRNNSFLRKTDRLQFKKSSERRKNSKKDQESRLRREKKKLTRKSFKLGDEEKKKLSECKMRSKLEVDQNFIDLNFNNVLSQRMTAKSISRSAEGTPSAGRKRQETPLGFKETRIGREKGKINDRKAFLILGDLEADNKYNELIKEAENIFENLRNTPLSKKRMAINLPNNKGKGVLRAEPSIEPANTWWETETRHCPQGEASKPETPSIKSPKNLGLKLSVEAPKKLQRLNFQTNKQSSLKATSSAHSPLDPLGPALKIFAVFKPVVSEEKQISANFSEDFENRKDIETQEQAKKENTFSKTSIVPFAFQSVDLGKPLTSYCPQSEPVKRKIYSCSKTYDKLVKQFENKPAIFEESVDGGLERVVFATSTRNSVARQKLVQCLNGKQGSAPKEEKKIGEKIPRGEILHSTLLGSRKSSVSNDIFSFRKPQKRSFDLDMFR